MHEKRAQRQKRLIDKAIEELKNCEQVKNGIYTISELKEGIGPPDKKDLYKPDLVLQDENGEIAYILEIETFNSARKAVPGAVIMADYCVGQRKQKRKPCLYFVMAEIDKNLERRVNVAQEYVRHVEKPIFVRTREICEWIK